MNVGESRELIKNMPDDTPAIVPDRFHLYRECEGEDATVGRSGTPRYPVFGEWFGEENRTVGEKPVRALVIR